MSTKNLISSFAVAGSLAAALAAPASAAPVDTQPSTSANWSGYEVGSGNANQQFSSVSGSWTEPTGDCSSGQGVASFWVGLGGASQQSQALEQTGTEVDCSGGSAQHSAWYEVVPAAPVKFDLAISAGDHMSATVTVSGNNVTMSLKDDTTGQSASKTMQADNVDLSSAEWIAEAPSQCDSQTGCTPVPLADFGKVNFTDASATAGGHTGSISDSSWQTQPVQLSPGASGGVVFPGGGIGVSSDGQTSSAGAQPTGLSSDGSGFSVSWVGDASQLSTGGDGSTGGSVGAGGPAGSSGASAGGYGDSGDPSYGDPGYGDSGDPGSGYGDGSGSGDSSGSDGATAISIGGGYYVIVGGYGY